MNCYACGQPAWQRCTRCDRPFCSSHGRVRCDKCRFPEHAVPSSMLYGSVVALMVLSGGLAVWLVAAWPQLVTPPPAPEGLVARVTETTTPTAVATEEPVPTATVGAATATATPSPEASPTATPEPRRYTVQPGDTVLGIALRLDSDVDAIVQANNLPDAASLSIGQELVIP